MIDLLNIALALFSIALGLFGWLAPKFTMEAVELQATGSMGPSEIRASSGALFVGLGVGALILGMPAGYAMIGFAWGFAAIGRMTSLMLDGASRKKWVYFLVEAAVAILALGANL